MPVLKSEARFREKFFADLEKLLLFVPLISAPFLDAFWTDFLREPSIPAALARASVAPISLRPAAGVQALVKKPLAAYPSGPERDQACVDIALALEKRLHKVCGKQCQASDAATMVAETARMRLLRKTRSATDGRIGRK